MNDQAYGRGKKVVFPLPHHQRRTSYNMFLNTFISSHSAGPCTLHNLLSCLRSASSSCRHCRRRLQVRNLFIYFKWFIHGWIPITAQCHEMVIKNVFSFFCGTTWCAPVILVSRPFLRAVTQKMWRTDRYVHKFVKLFSTSYRWMSSVVAVVVVSAFNFFLLLPATVYAFAVRMGIAGTIAKINMCMKNWLVLSAWQYLMPAPQSTVHNTVVRFRLFFDSYLSSSSWFSRPH